jgi:spore maturation protein SpmB
MVAIFVAIGMVRASGTLDMIIWALSPALDLIGMPTEALSVGLMRPLSGSGSFALMSEIVHNSPNSFLADLVSVMQGSTETTFYVLAVYFGAAGVVRTRYAVPAALSSDVAGIFLSLFFTRLFLG